MPTVRIMFSTRPLLLPTALLALLAGAVSASPSDADVRVQILEGIDREEPWKALDGDTPDEFRIPAFALTGVPRTYSAQGLIVDRSNPFRLRATARLELPSGKQKLLLRSLNAARLFLDGELIAETRFLVGNADGHESVPDIPDSGRGVRPLPAGHTETIVDLEVSPGSHLLRLEAIVGGKRLRTEIGELVVAVAPADAEASPFRVVSPSAPFELSDASWHSYQLNLRALLDDENATARRRAGRAQEESWRERAAAARRYVDALPPLDIPHLPAGTPAHNAIDRFVGQRLVEAGVEPLPLTDDWSFLRRLSLDVRGTVPQLSEIESFVRDVETQADRPEARARWIDRLIEDPAWADHWVSYWQDVLAENPGILKPKLNNTGPFRWWIHDAFLDNKPIDRFATELILMQGSVYGGGPAGFAMSTQNDVPMAAKAHVLSTAFLGIDLKCARCHDPPYQRFEQKDLFGMAAMLHGEALTVPATSSVPRSPEELERMVVSVTLEPGSAVEPTWPFGHLTVTDHLERAVDVPREEASEAVSHRSTREQLAALITAPQNVRFARVIANRLWKRFMGRGIVEPADDWENAAAVSHPQLLDYLGRELVRSGYDLKHLARLILSSHTYQRRGLSSDAPAEVAALFAGPIGRRMSAEQLVDSLFHAVGKQFDCEELNLDVDARRPIESFLNLGVPRRAWEFASLSNERDRPALSMPVAQSIVDVLTTFGWRDSRQDPLTVRENIVTVLQPLLLANGIVANRVATLSEGSALTVLALEERSVDELVRCVFLSILSRPPSGDEAEVFGRLLGPGFDARRRAPSSVSTTATADKHHAVSWSNHLSAEATRIKIALEERARHGDTPTPRLEPEWRERMEDMVWALLNSPEFLLLP